MNGAMNDFCKEIADKYDLNIEELNEIWSNMKQFKGVANKTSGQKTRKKSAYVVFSKIERQHILETQPDAKFGEISKMVSQKWKTMSQEEKDKYKENDDAPSVTKPVVSKSKQKSMKELRDLCKEKGLKTSGSKKELMCRLEEAEKSDDESEVVSNLSSPSSVFSMESHALSETIDDDRSISSNKYSKMKLADLKEICKEKKISIKGNKQALIQRLLEFD
jgi:hypothetical protein